MRSRSARACPTTTATGCRRTCATIPNDPASQAWAGRATELSYVGRTGTDSCSTVGGGGFTGCFNQIVSQARAERRAAGVGDVNWTRMARKRGRRARRGSTPRRRRPRKTPSAKRPRGPAMSRAARERRRGEVERGLKPRHRADRLGLPGVQRHRRRGHLRACPARSTSSSARSRPGCSRSSACSSC